MPCYAGCTSDGAADPRNEATRRAGTRRAVFVAFPADRLAVLLTAATSLPATPKRCMDGIDILRRQP
jgi:hypothetical protein